jgi:proteasome lid subunit RPN8/RPN11
VLDTLLKLYDPSESREICGLIDVYGHIHLVENVHAEPEKGYRMDAVAALRLLNDQDITATVHTHPKGDSNLSQEDYAGFSLWPELTHYVVGHDGVTKYWFENGLLLQEKLK